MTDTLADLLIRIKNAYLARREEVIVPASKAKLALSTVMAQAGYITAVSEVKDEAGHNNLKLSLKYVNGEPALTDVKKISKPGCRCYVACANIPAVLHGYGLAILSTSAGIMSGSDAKKKNLGGELIGEIW